MKKHLLLAALATLFASSSAVAADGDITVTVDMTNCTRSKDQFETTITNNWFQGWESIPSDESTPKVGITQEFTSAARMNNVNAPSLSIQATTTANQQSYYMTVRTGNYYISAYSFTAVPAFEGASINGTALSTDGTVISATGTPSDKKLYLTIETTEVNNGVNNIKLTDFTITLSPMPPVRYVQISSEHYFVDGAKYVIGHVGVNQAVWGGVNPLVFTANAQNNGYTFTSVPGLDFNPETMVFTAKVRPEYICGHSHANHAGPHKVVQLYREANGSTAAIKINGTATKGMAALTDLATNIEFVPISETLSGLTNDPVFELHVNLDPSNLTHFKQIHAILKDGTLGWYSRGNGDGFDILKGDGAAAGSSYSGLTRVYLQVDPANLEPAAKAYWNQIIEEDIAANPSYSDAYKAALRKRALPDLDGMTADNLVEKLTEAYQSVEYDFTANWTAANAVRPTGTVAYGKAGFPYAVLKNTTNNSNNIVHSNDNFKIHKGSGSVTSCSYTLSSFHPLLQVMGMEFDFTVETLANGGELTNTVVTVGDQTYQWAGEAIHVNAPKNTIITVSGSNNSVTIPSFSLNVNKADAELYDAMVAAGGKPQSSGWYQIISAKGIDAKLGHYLTLDSEEYLHSNGCYGYIFSEDISAAPAASYIYVDVENNTYKMMSANGHWINEDCIAKTTKQAASAQQLATDANDPTSIRISRWNTFTGGNVVRLGKSSNSDNRWFVMPVDAAANYDIWTVEINGGSYSENVLQIKNNCNVSCTIPANKGAQTVYNGGKFFFTKGTVPTAANFTVSDSETDNVTPVVTVDAATKTITVNHLTKEEYLAPRIEALENAFAPYLGQTIYAEGIVANALNAALEGLQAAAGDDEALTAAEIAAINAHMTGQPSAENILAFNKSAEGRVVHFVNYRNNYGYARAMSHNNSADNKQIIMAENPDKHDPANMWMLENCDDNGNFSLRNIASGLYAHHPAENSALTMVEAPHANQGRFTITPVANNENNAVLINYQGNNNKFLHYQESGHVVVGWGGSIQGSLWNLIIVDNDDELAEDIDLDIDLKQTVEGSMTSNAHVFTFSHKTLTPAINDAVNENVHVLTLKKVIAKQTETTTPETSVIRRKAANVSQDMYTYDTDFEPVRIPLSNANVADNNTITVTTPKLEEGYYEVNVPAAMFTLGDKHSKASTVVINVANDGGVTGIENVEANVAAPAVDVIFDLQGRRLSKPMRGINIINGRKVLVK